MKGVMMVMEIVENNDKCKYSTKTVDSVFVRSDWLLKLEISSAIHWFTSSSSEQATPNSPKLQAKWLPGLLP